MLEEAELERLTEAAARDPEGAAAVFRRALALRDAVDRLFRAVARSATPDERDLALVWKEHAEAVANGRLLPADDGFAWSWEGTPVDLGRPLWPVARSAVELLTGGDLHRVRECPWAGDLRLAVLRHQPQPRPALVQYGGLRQRGEDAPPLRPPARRHP